MPRVGTRSELRKKANSLSIFQKDRKVSQAIHDEGGRYVSPRVLELIEGLGSGKLWFPLAFVALVTLDGSKQIVAYNFFAGLVLDVLLVGSMKFFVQRRRPQYSASNIKQYAPVVNIDSYSMPSGHTSRSVYVALFCTFVFTRQSWIASVAILWGITTGVSRIVMGRHYLSDVIVGTAVAFVNFALLTKGTFSSQYLLLTEKGVTEIVKMILLRL